MEAWHFAKEDRRLNYGDNRLIETGITHTVEPPVKCCEHGLHGSLRAIDALIYAPGPVICRVKLDGAIDIQHDKVAASERTYLWVADATETLRTFSRLCALDVVHLWDAPQIVIDYLNTGDDSLKAAARDAAWAAARDAAWAAAWAAAWDAVGAAARAAVGAAAWAAARAAAWDAARAAARAAVGAAQNTRLESMLMELAP